MFKRGRESIGKKEIEGRTTGRGSGGRVIEDWGEKGERKRMSRGHINFLLFPQYFQIIKALVELKSRKQC